MITVLLALVATIVPLATLLLRVRPSPPAEQHRQMVLPVLEVDPVVDFDHVTAGT